MRIHILSDLHLEFGLYEEPLPAAEVVVLAGDVSTALRGLEWIRNQRTEARMVYVVGNHEYYGGALPKLTDELQRRGAELGVDVLERGSVVIGGVRFFGCTLWTDFQLLGETSPAAVVAGEIMNDYRRIRVSPEYRRLRPADTASLHRQTRRWLEDEVESGRTVGSVIVSHHAPSLRSVPPTLRDDPVSAAYASHLDDLVERSAARLWVHGHTHYCIDYEIGGTRVVSNQRGYVDEPAPGFRPDLVVELGGG